jgi:uncharacterized protein (DUF2147 family)
MIFWPADHALFLSEGPLSVHRLTSLKNISAFARVVLVLSGCSCVSTEAAAQSADGVWARDDGLVRARIAPCGVKICATNTWVNDPAGSEKVGDKLVLTVIEASAGHWTGTAFDPRRNMTFSMDMNIDGARLTTQGCVLGRLVCRSVGWARVSR